MSCWRSTPPMPSTSTATTTSPASALVEPGRKRRDAAHLLEDLCAGRAAARLGLLPAGDRRRAEPHPRPVQRHRAGAGGRGGGGRGCRRLARARAHNDRWLPWLSRAARGARPAARRRASAISCCRASPTIRAGMPMPPSPFCNRAASSPARWAAYGLPQHLRITIGTGEEMEARRRGACRIHGRGMSEPDVRPGGADRHRPDRLLAGPRVAARLPRHAHRRLRAPRRDAGRGARARHRRRDNRRPGRRGARTPTSSCSRRRSSAYAEIGRRIAPALRDGAIVTDVGSVKGARSRRLGRTAGRRALRARPSGCRHRTFRAGIRLRRAVPRPLVHPDAAARDRPGGGRQGDARYGKRPACGWR